MWLRYDTLVYTNPDPDNQAKKILGFDLDMTLVRSKNPRKTHHHADWKWFTPEVPEILRQWRQLEGIEMVIFTNQAGIGNDPKKLNEFLLKMDLIFTDLGFPIATYISTGKDQFRKPSPISFGFAFSGRTLQAFTFIGDAAGRLGDFADTDRKFALNVEKYYGVPTLFQTPEHLFLGEPEKPFRLSGFDPETLNNRVEVLDFQPLNRQEMILMIGRPASGKSTIAQDLARQYRYKIVSNDLQGTEAKTLRLAEQLLREGHSIIVDNTNGRPTQRAKALDLARKYQIPVRGIIVKIPEDLNKHLNVVREILTQKHIPEVALRTFDKYYVEPSLDEGFTELIKTGFSFDPDRDPEFTRLYRLRF
jgi:bifunctional polynucleotide phosphatase/kinase